MKESNYDNPRFFSQYRHFPRSVEGPSAAGEWHVLQKLSPDFSGKRVLDLGRDSDWHCRYAADHGAAAVIRVDLPEKMLEKARAGTFDSRIRYVRGAVEEVDLPLTSSETVSSPPALRYVEELEPVFRRMQGWSAPDGDSVFSCRYPVSTVEGPQEWYPGPGGTPLHWPVGRYFTEGRHTARFLGCDMVKYHHTLIIYVQTLLKIGFVFKALVEPKPDSRLMDVPGMVNELRRPMMLLLSTHRPEQDDGNRFRRRTCAIGTLFGGSATRSCGLECR